MMVLVCVDDYGSIKEGFSNYYYYIYTYEKPRLRQRAPIQTSNRRDVIHSTRIQDQGDLYSGRTDLDSHVDTTVTGRNCTVMHYTERSCDVAPFSDTYEPSWSWVLVECITSRRLDVLIGASRRNLGCSYV